MQFKILSSFLCVVAALGCFFVDVPRLNWMVKTNIRRTIFVLFTTLLLVAQGEHCWTMYVSIIGVYVSIPFFLLYAISTVVGFAAQHKESKLIKEQDARTSSTIAKDSSSVVALEPETTATKKANVLDYA